VPISSIVEAARVPSQLLGQLFVERGLITPEELEGALAEQKTSGKRLGEILVNKGYVSGPTLTTVLAEQLGVEMEKQEGYGSGLWSEIKQRHPRRGRGNVGEAPSAEPERGAPQARLELIDGLPDQGGLLEPTQGDELEAAGPDPEPESLRQQLAFAATRLNDERTAHEGTKRLLEETRAEARQLSQEAEEWRERAGRSESSDAKEAYEQQLAELRSELAERDAARSRETDSRKEVEAKLRQLQEDARVLMERLEAERATSVEAREQLEQATAEAARLKEIAAEADELHRLAPHVQELEQELTDVRTELTRREQAAANRDAELKLLQEQLEEERALTAAEAEGRAAVELQMDELRAVADGLIERLQEESESHGTTRQELGRVEAELADRQPLFDTLAAREYELLACARLLEEVSAGLAAAKLRHGE
jgi:hypothetical protein